MFRWRFGPQPGTNEKTEYEKRIETSGFFFFCIQLHDYDIQVHDLSIRATIQIQKLTSL